MRSPTFFLTLLALGGVLLPDPAAHADTARQEPAQTHLDSQLRAELEHLNEELRKTPDRIPLLSRRGDCHLFLGQFRESVADFESMIALDPSLDAGHWRLGIAYHFNRQFEASSKQFAKYHAYDGRDRENGLWKFLADASLAGVQHARKGMLEYTAFDREPFPLLYDLYAGKTTPLALLADLESRGQLSRPMVRFFAHYYCGLWEALDGNPGAASEHLSQAVQLFSPESSQTSGPGYMWQVARLHRESARTGFPTLQLPSGPTSRP